MQLEVFYKTKLSWTTVELQPWISSDSLHSAVGVPLGPKETEFLCVVHKTRNILKTKHLID